MLNRRGNLLRWPGLLLVVVWGLLVSCATEADLTGRDQHTGSETEVADDGALDQTVEVPDAPELSEIDQVNGDSADVPGEVVEPLPADEDNDTISDLHEGRAQNIDTDNDTVPDYLDLDSDGDTILDRHEAGDSDLRTPPIDSDGDTVPDFRDLDSDNNQIPDSVEGVFDLDGDTVPNFRDFDNDGDSALDTQEIVGGAADCDGDGVPDPLGTPANPRDCDGDGVPDYNEEDSDKDYISDRHEGFVFDTDRDGFLDRYDQDSDGDTLPDAIEAGDFDLRTPPVDTDGDTIPDYRDLDSDNDGLSDAIEAQIGTNPRNPDTDGDGASDLVEYIAGTDPLDSNDNPRANGDFIFLVPYEKPTAPLRDTLEFATSIRYADVYFSFDRSASMIQEIQSLSGGLANIINQLRCFEYAKTCAINEDCQGGQVCGPNGKCMQDPLAGDGCIADMWTGFGHWEDIDTFQNRVSLQPNPQMTSQALAAVTYTGAWEAPFQPPACVVNGSFCNNASTINCSTTPGRVGCVGYRPDAIRIYIQVSDADDQCLGSRCGQFTAAFAGQQMRSLDIKFIGLYGYGPGADTGGNGTPESVVHDLGVAAGTVNAEGKPFIYPCLDSEVVPKTVSAVREIARGVPLNVTIHAADLPDDDGDALQFIDYVEVNVSNLGNCSPVSQTADTNGDGYRDAFPALLPGTPVCWDVVPVAVNTMVPAEHEPKLFKARLTVLGDGSPLDSRNVFFLLPPLIAGTIN